MSELVTRVPADDGGARRGLHRPAEGWTAVVLSTLIVLVMAWAVDDPAWVNGREELTDSLLAMALMGFAFGALGPKVGWGRWTTHGIGAVFAGLLIPIMAGWAMVPGTSPWAAFRIAAEGSAEAYLDIVWRGLQYTSQEVHYIVVLGSLLWGTAQFFGYAVFGHHKALNGVVMVGVVVVVNMALTSRNQLPFLILFTVASLFLLIAMHAFDERSTWVRRRIGDPSSLASMYLKGGTVFIALAVTGSLLLTTRAASAPLAGAWDGIDDQLISFGEKFARLFPVGPDVRGGGGVTFGSSAVIRPSWFRGEGTAFTARIDDATMPEVRWRAATYDTFALRAWVQTGVTSVPVEAGAALLAGTPEEASANLTIPVSATIETDAYKDSLALAPGTPVDVDRFANVLLQGDERSFAGVDLPGGRGAYTITAAVLKLADEEAPVGGANDGITGNQLGAASTEYPAEITARYTDVPEGAMGPEATRLLATILASAPDRNPYTLAELMEDYLRSDAFEYNVNGTGPCDGSAVECFAATRRGYCLHYASTMAILLRAANPDNRIPTRLVQGFLPGTRDAAGLVETVEAQAAHAWVEVYFPGYGWIPFDPTGGGVGRQTVIPAGPVVEPAAPTPVGSRLPDEPLPTRGAGGTPGEEAVQTPGPQPLDRIVLIILAVLLAVVVGALAIAAWIRGPRSEISPDAAWTTMLRAASRFGFGPRPTQTIYEYAGSLAELVPVAREDLQTVADAKVETQYAKVHLGGARLEAVRDATRRLRISLLRLALRRPRRRRRH